MTRDFSKTLFNYVKYIHILYTGIPLGWRDFVYNSLTSFDKRSSGANQLNLRLRFREKSRIEARLKVLYLKNHIWLKLRSFFSTIC